MVHTFKTSSTNILAYQPATAGEKLILRSTNTGDTMNVTITGTVGGVADSETIALTGKVEAQTTKTFTAINSITLASAPTGTVTVMGQGVTGTGDVRVDSVPASGATIEIGLTGSTRTYTYRSPARITITTVAFASLGQGDYIDIVFGATTKRFWFDKDAAGTGAPSNPGGGLYEVDIVTGDTADSVATKLRTSMVANLGEYVTSVATNVITLTRLVLGTGSATDGAAAAATGFTITTVEAGTADAANQVRTGYHTDGVAITTAQVATNLASAINASGGTAGTHYGTGTTAHAQITASASTSVVTLTDRLAIGRQLSWTLTQGATNHTLRTITGATTGQAKGTVRSPVVQLLEAQVSLDTEALDTATLPAAITPTSDWILVGGKRFSIQIATGQTASAIAFKYQTSNTKAVARDGATTLTITTTSATASDRNKLYTPSEAAEYVRLVVTSNPNTLDTIVNAKLITG